MKKETILKVNLLQLPLMNGLTKKKSPLLWISMTLLLN